MASYIDKRALLSGLKWLLPLGLSVACYIWLSSHQERLIALAQSQGWILLYPRLLDLLALSPLLIALHLFSRVAQQAWARGLTISLRLGFFASIVLALSQPTRFEDGTLSETLYLIDVSDSMTDEALSEAITEIKKRELPETERLGIYSYATEVKYLGDKLESLPEDAEKLRATLAGKERAGSHSASALRSVNAWFHTDRLSRMVIFSDRKSTAGDTLLARQALEKSGVELSVVEPSQSLSKEVAIAALIPPEHPKVAQSFFVKASVYSSVAQEVEFEFFQDSAPSALEAKRKVQLEAGTTELSFPARLSEPGDVRFDLKISSYEQDHFQQNNFFSAQATVEGSPKVLIVGERAEGEALARALSAQKFDVELQDARFLGENIEAYRRTDFVLLHNVQATSLSRSAQVALLQYVKDGGGLLYAGGVNGYSQGGWGSLPLGQALPLESHATETKKLPNVALYLVIDSSGSMEGEAIEMAKQACLAAVDALHADDLIGVANFDSVATRRVPLQAVSQRRRIASQIATLTASGGTVIFGALDMALRDLSSAQAKRKHVILLSDGISDRGGLTDIAKSMLGEGITLSTVGLGSGTDKELLESLADYGGGRYYAAAEARELPRIFISEASSLEEQESDDFFEAQIVRQLPFLSNFSGSFPYLRGFVETQMKPGPHELLMQLDGGEPLLVRSGYGRGQLLAWTSDFTGRWATDWLRWSALPNFLGQLIRAHQKNDEQDMARSLSMVSDGVHQSVSLSAIDENGELQTGLKGSVTATGEDGESREFTMQERAPGDYIAELSEDLVGSMGLKAALFQDEEGSSELPKNKRGEALLRGRGRIEQAFPLEYAPEMALDPALDPARPTLAAAKPRLAVDGYQALLFIALSALLLELLARRLGEVTHGLG